MKYVYALKYFLRNIKRKIDSDYKLRKRLNRAKVIISVVVVIVICFMLNYKRSICLWKKYLFWVLVYCFFGH